MSDRTTCIVCLGSLCAPDAPPPPLQRPLSPDSDPKPQDSDGELSDPRSPKSPELIANLPCGHNLHDDCLRPWVERANSCPICRHSFNSVQLSETLGGRCFTSRATRPLMVPGPVNSSYDVTDRAQEAEIDPSMFTDEPEEETTPCPKCGNADNEDVMLLCDRCNAGYHTYCVGLDTVPTADWFCESCEATRALPSVSESRGWLNQHTSNRRTRAQIRRARNQDDISSSSWARVWQSVWDRLNIDLDFPFEDPAPAPRSRSHHRRDGVRAWERRLQVAERQGGASRFRDTAPAIFDRPTLSRPRHEPPRPESTEEVMAWNALEKARDIQGDPSSQSRKRKSATSSPTEPTKPTENARKRARRSATSSPTDLAAPKPQRPLKRPNTRRAPAMSVVTNGTNGESSRPRQRSIASVAASSPDATGNPPTFLQSLLQEVESSAVPEGSGLQTHLHSDHPSPQAFSPAASPAGSNHPSPGAMSGTPPPISPRSLSPVPLTSRIEPVYPKAPDLNYEDLSPMGKALHRRTSKSQTRVPRWVMTTASKEAQPRARSEETSPTRASMSLPAKESVQKLVKEALREPYTNNQVNKDQYTDINRAVSRLLYEKVGENGIAENEGNQTWQQMANQEVQKAIAALKNNRTSEE